MNNLRQIQILDEGNYGEGIPYKFPRNVKLPNLNIENGSEFYNTDINNAFRQLVDNDKCIDASISMLSSNKEGPKVYDENMIRNGYSGYKWMEDKEDVLDIWRNIHDGISIDYSDSIQELVGKDVKCIDFFNDTYYACTTDGLYAIQQNDSVYSGVSCFFKKGTNTYLKTPQNIIFPVQGTSNISVIVISADSQAMNISKTGQIKQAKNIKNYKNDIWILGQSEILSCRYSNIKGMQYGYKNTLNFESGIQPTSIEFLEPYTYSDEITDNDNMIVGTTRGLYRIYNYRQNPNPVQILSSYFGKSKSISKMYKLSKNDFLLFSTDGLYEYKYVDNIISKKRYDDNLVTAVEIHEKSKDTQYYIQSISNEIYKTSNFRRLYNILSVPDTTAVIQDMYYCNNNNMLFATSKGLYYSTLKSHRINDTSSSRFTLDDFYGLYQENISSVDKQISDTLSTHVKECHGNSSLLSTINEDYVDTNFNYVNFCIKDTNGQYSSITSSARCDYIETIDFGNSQSSEDIMVQIKNFTTSNKFVNVDCSWIVKLWKSGVNEFIINIPTTKTYYINHVPCSPNCCVDPSEQIKRPNLYQSAINNPSFSDSISSSVSSYYTEVQVKLNRARYEISTVLNYGMTGNSLPLGIYKDATYEEGEDKSGSMFHSVIEPSLVVDSANTMYSDKDYHIFKGYCFGSDAQSFDIMTIAKTTFCYGGKNIYTVVFDGNGGSTEDGKTQYKQNIRLMEDTKEFYPNARFTNNRFRNEGKVFFGWTKRKDNQNAYDVDKHNCDKIKVDEFNYKTVITYYACWLEIDTTTTSEFELG